MNSVRKIRELNQKELESGVSPNASWHADYRDTAYIYIGGLPHELSEGDVITIFSQYGEPTYINLIRDKETGKSRGFAFLKYEDQRSTDLAVDNLGGAQVLGRTLKVDHTRYQRRKGEEPSGSDNTLLHASNALKDQKEQTENSSTYNLKESGDKKPVIKEEQELARLMQDLDDEDPMKSYFVQKKRDEIALALAKHESYRKREKLHKNRTRHHRSEKKESSVRSSESRMPASSHSERKRKHD
ncbi:U2 snRNP component ist3 [Golovinomyces cichoracearum]|uniref:U2 snRNP component ist3 n=1 Tax=Golovinomyces cichoracearum TaxID=62708 RepID=A0A420HAK6_9PEZI|nr:U2 snRNP component ist3 [Golovinomyces cichoracearum]